VICPAEKTDSQDAAKHRPIVTERLFDLLLDIT